MTKLPKIAALLALVALAAAGCGAAAASSTSSSGSSAPAPASQDPTFLKKLHAYHDPDFSHYSKSTLIALGEETILNIDNGSNFDQLQAVVQDALGGTVPTTSEIEDLATAAAQSYGSREPQAATVVLLWAEGKYTATVNATSINNTRAAVSSTSLSVSVQPDSANSEVPSSILVPTSCSLTGTTVTATGTYGGPSAITSPGSPPAAAEFYRRYGAVVKLYAYDASGTQVIDLSAENSPAIDVGNWTLTGTVPSGYGTPASCVVAAQATQDFQGAGSAGS
jgi:hypothetical protein